MRRFRSWASVSRVNGADADFGDDGSEFIGVHGCYSDLQPALARDSTARMGRIVVQIRHYGRISHEFA